MSPQPSVPSIINRPPRDFRLLIYEGPTPSPPGERPADAVSRVFRVDAAFDRAGTWAGVSDIIEQAYLSARAHGLEESIDRHNYELNRVLQKYRHEFALKYATLTDSTLDAERTRNFPLDRAYRLINGLIELTLAWKRREGAGERWVVVVENFDRAQHLATRYFGELARRGMGSEGIEVLVDTAMGSEALGLRLARTRAVETDLSGDDLGTPVAPPEELDADAVAEIGRTLISNDFDAWERIYPSLLRYFRRVGDEVRCADVGIHALCLCNHYGYYHEAASFADTILKRLDELVKDDQILRWNYIGNLFTGLVTTGREDVALRMLLEQAAPFITLAEYRARMHYLLSMIYLRFLKAPDMEAAERHILEAIAAIDGAEDETDPADFVFLRVFINNGLAFLRVRQGRHTEAMTLCSDGYALLTGALGEEKHKLHRSVLQYNIAQVYSMLGEDENAIEYYRKAMLMDPYYSEYYNEAGNLLQRSGRFDEAEAMYERAIEYSAPYPEVHFNKGICALNLSRSEDAVAQFGTSLELNPLQTDLYVLRAELRSETGDTEAAIRDYDAALILSPDNVAANVNRAVLHYEAGSFKAALEDMDRVIALQPDKAEHYLNRAEIHKAMAQQELYRRDLAAAEACEAAA